MGKWAAAISVTVIILAGLIYYLYEQQDYDFDPSLKEYEVVKKWNLPNIMDEISGQVWLGDDKIGCIQDEKGIIYTYDLKSSKIINELEFAELGDFEGITQTATDYWVIESNGQLYRIPKDFKDISDVQTQKLEFESGHNIEGISTFSDGNLYISVKNKNLNKDEEQHKSIYVFDPYNNVLDTKPVINIEYNDPAFNVLKKTEPDKYIRPSDIGFNSRTNEIYVVDGEIPKLLVMDRSGKIKKLYQLDPGVFLQPEGICFSNDGRLFISSEGKGADAAMFEVILN